MTEARARDRQYLAVSLLLFFVAFTLRFAIAAWLAGEPVWDGHYYDFGARRIAAGAGYSDDRIIDGHAVWHPWCHYPVGYSAYLAFFYKLLGPANVSAHLANALVGGLSAVVVYLLAREALTPVRARVAGALVALHPGLVVYGALTMSEPLSGLLVMAAFLVALVVARKRSHPLAGPAYGAFVLGIAALVRPQALLCAPFLVFALPRTLPKTGARWLWRVATPLVACAVAIVPVLPWTARNCRVMDGCALVSTNAGWNLAIGSFPRATGRFEGLHSSDGCREVTGQVQQDRCWLEYGVAHIKADPVRWLKLVPAKLAYTFDHESFAIEYLREARPSEWPEPRRVAARSLLTIAHRLLVLVAPLAFVAFAVRGRRVQSALLAGTLAFAVFAFSRDTPMFWPIVVVASVLPWLPLKGRPEPLPSLLMSAGLIATTAAAHAIFFGEDRYHVAITPALCLLAAAALRPAADRQNTRGANT